MDVQEIREYLPHRYPFLLVDRVTAIEPGKSITALKNVTINEEFFQGHFPEMPVMPGVLLVEAMAQAAGILGFKSMGKKPSDGSTYLLAGTDKMRFKRPVVPGDQVVLKAEYLSDKRGIWKFEVSASVDGVLCAGGTIICADKKN